MKKSGFLEGTMIATIAIILTKILGMIYVIPFYAVVGVQGSALYAYAYNIYVIFLDISSAGIPAAMSKITKEYQTLGQEDAKVRAYKIGKKIIRYLSILLFIILLIFANQIAGLILGDLQGGNTIEDVAFAIRCVSLAILVIPFLSVTKGYLQGHNIIDAPSNSQVIEQVVRIAVILGGSYIALKVFHLSLTTSVGIAVSGAFVGGLAAMLYILYSIKKHKEVLSSEETIEENKVTDKEIRKKILSYAIPFIIIDVAVSIYSFVDMVFISRTMTALGFDASATEFITTSVTTWSGKIGMVVNSIAMGLTMSLIPNIVEAYTLKKWDNVEEKFNRALQIILVVCIPMVLGISLLSKPIWSIFYGTEALELGGLVLKVYIFIPLFFNLYMVTSSTLQSMNKFKTVYITTILGYATNAILDVPLMLLCHSLGLEPFIGACLASMLGYLVSVVTTLKYLNKEHQLSYKDTYKTFLKTLISSFCMVVLVLILKFAIKVDYEDKIACIIYVAFISLIGAISYLLIAYKQGILSHIFGKNFLKKILRKIKLKKRKESSTKEK